MPGTRTHVGMMLAAAAGVALGGAGMYSLTGRGAMEGIVHDYVLTHPEIIPEAINRLQAREAGGRIAAVRGSLETPFAGAWAGNPHGNVTLVMFTDYNCGFCRASAPDIQRLLAEDRNLKVVWREIPILGATSEAAARDALAAAKQGRYPAFHTAMFAGPAPSAIRIATVGHAIGIDPARAAKDRVASDINREIAANLALASKIGVDGTPAFIIGNRMLSGAVGHDALAQAIAEARRPAG